MPKLSKNSKAADQESADNDFESMDLDVYSDSNSESENDEERTRETGLTTYLGMFERQFIPHKFNEYSNSLDMVIAKGAQFDVDNADKWHCSSRHKSLKVISKHNQNLNEICPLYNKKFWIESAVLGGQLYRLLGGAHHPEMLVCEGEADSVHFFGKRYYRLSKDLSNFGTWAQFDRASSPNKPIIGLTSIFLIADFLADLDMNQDNYGLIESELEYTAVKIDPECCFSYEFHCDNEEYILDRLQNLRSEMPHKQFKRQELFQTLAHIISTPMSTYIDIIDSCFSPEYQKQKEIYISSLSKRIEFYKGAAMKLKGFKEFCEHQDQEREDNQKMKYEECERTYESNRPFQSRAQKWLEAISTTTLPPLPANPYGFFSSVDMDDGEKDSYVPKDIFSLN